MRCPEKARQRTEDACQPASEAILAYGAGFEDSLFSQHLEECSECRQLAEAQREVWSKLDAWTPSPVPSDFDERLYARIEAYQQQSWWSRALTSFTGKRSSKPAMPFAVACTALIAALLLNSTLPTYVPAPRVDVRSESGIDLQQVERALDDLDMVQQLGMSAASYRPLPGTL